MFVATESCATINTWCYVLFPQSNRFSKLGTLPFSTQPPGTLIWGFTELQPASTKIDAHRTLIVVISSVLSTKTRVKLLLNGMNTLSLRLPCVTDPDIYLLRVGCVFVGISFKDYQQFTPCGI
jgi:hypothetical protein